MSLRVNGTPVDQMAFDETIVQSGQGDNTRSHSLPLYLNGGDTLWIETAANRVYEMYSDSFFAAALLRSS